MTLWSSSFFPFLILVNLHPFHLPWMSLIYKQITKFANLQSRWDETGITKPQLCTRIAIFHIITPFLRSPSTVRSRRRSFFIQSSIGWGGELLGIYRYRFEIKCATPATVRQLLQTNIDHSNSDDPITKRRPLSAWDLPPWNKSSKGSNMHYNHA